MIKPTVLLIFVLGIAGYLYLDCSHKHHFELRRSSGYHTFFKSTAYGLFFFAISSVIYLALFKLGTSLEVQFDLGAFILNEAFQLTSSRHNAALLDISLITLSLSFLYPRIKYFKKLIRERKRRLEFEYSEISHDSNLWSKTYKIFKAWKTEVRTIRQEYLQRAFVNDAESPEFSRLVGRSWDYGLPILFTMNDRKVYIGYVYEFAAKPNVSDIMILPIMGGYRTDNELKFVKMTPYEEVVEEITNLEKQTFISMVANRDNGIDEEKAIELLESQPLMFDKNEFWLQFIVTLPFRDIVHAHIHDIEQEERFADRESKLSQFDITFDPNLSDKIDNLLKGTSTPFPLTKD